MEANTWKERIIMPIQNGKYVSPNWQNGGPPALNAAELNAICQSLQADDQQIKDNLPGIIQSIASGVFLNSSGQLVNKAGSQITVPSSQLSDQVHIVTGSYVGTGTYGVDHPCSLTFDFSPKIVIVQQASALSGFNSNSCGSGFLWLAEQTSQNQSLNGSHSYSGSASLVFKLEGTQIRWYSEETGGYGLYYQGNVSGQTYNFLAIG